MNKQTALRIINPILMLLMLFQVAALPVKELLPIDTMLLYKLHALDGFLIGLLVIVHVVLNWSWIRANYFAKKKGGK